jgi:hypothetical protein
MFTKLREPFGKAGLIVAVVALVFAMLGGAYAATNSGGKATASAKGKPGPRGKTGKTGSAGPAGPAGAPGAKGDTGAAGSNGTNGTNGANGESVTVTTLAPGSTECAEGGAKFSNKSGTAHACSAASGGGFPEFLPSEKTETGAWTDSTDMGEEEREPGVFSPASLTSISFPIPLELPLEASHVHFLTPSSFCDGLPGEEEPEPGVIKHPHAECISALEIANAPCTGTAASPEAPPGELCVYVTQFINVHPGGSGFGPIIRPSHQAGGPESEGASTSGANIVLFPGSSTARGLAFGTWAVTAP